MDQSRLDELKRLLQKRHQEPKRGLEQNSDGENSGTSNLGVSNFKAQNSEISNSEVSNFEVSNSRTLNFEASNFEILNSEPLNSRAPNSEASNSETLNSNPGALNLKAELEAKADQNSAYENNAEQQNFILDDSDSLQQNSKARDYDKEPIIVKNYERLLISTITFLYAPMILGGYILSIWDLIFSILSAIFLKIFFHFLIVGNFKNFSFFSAIVVDYPYYEQKNTYYLSSILSAKNYLVCVYDAERLNEIKEWFLIRKHIDIDKIEKYYLS
jgi:hypothetical protein